MMKKPNSMSEYLIGVAAQSEAMEKQRAAARQEEKNRQTRAALDAMGTAGEDECCGECDDCELAAMDSGMAEAIGTMDSDDAEAQLAQMTYLLMVLAKRAGMEQTAREAFEVWLTV